MTLLFWRTVLPSALRTVTEEALLPRVAVAEDREGVTERTVPEEREAEPLEERTLVPAAAEPERTVVPLEAEPERTVLPLAEPERTVLPLVAEPERTVEPPPMLKDEPEERLVLLPDEEPERTVLPEDEPRTGFCEEAEGVL